MKEKKRLCWLLPVVILLLAAVGWFFWKYTFVDGTVTARSADTIDLRGREISEKKLRTIESRFPDAHILWDVTVGGKSFDGESESIVTADFTTEDIPSFARLKNLKEADVSACSDFSAILTERSRKNRRPRNSLHANDRNFRSRRTSVYALSDRSPRNRLCRQQRIRKTSGQRLSHSYRIQTYSAIFVRGRLCVGRYPKDLSRKRKLCRTHRF